MRAPPSAFAPRSCLLLALGLAGPGCGGDLPDPALGVATGEGLRVAGGGDEGGRTLVVSAIEPRTHVGHYRAGQRVQIAVLDAQWNHAPGPDLYDARGARGKPCLSAGAHICVGHGAPFMGLVLITVPDSAPSGAAPAPCEVQQRLYVPNGVEFAIPFDADLALGPNDWEDGLDNNAGFIEVEVERALGKREPALDKKTLQVSALVPRTPVGRFLRGEYVRINVLDGGWNNHPGVAMASAAGYPGQRCDGAGHQCVGGEGQPLMGLILVMSTCGPTALSLRQPDVERAYIPDGAEVVLARAANLYLAPNDHEDSLANNTGSARVRVRVFDK